MTDPVPHLDNLPRFTEPALCAEADADAFFPEKGGSAHAAKAICWRCLARDECLAWALANDERHGVWGGLSAKERQRLQPAPRTPGRPAGSTKPIDHGKESGHQAHLRRGEKACRACAEAATAARNRRATA